MPYTLDEDIANTIAHEIAHGVGAPHHGKPSEYYGKREITEKMVDWKVFGVDGLRVTSLDGKPIALTGKIGRPGNESSGDTHCIMAYANYYQWAAVGKEGGPYFYYAQGPNAPGKAFCRSAKAT